MKELSKTLLSRLWRAIIEFDMIQKEDHILIGLSGGKDSMFMTKALAQIKKYAPFPFELSAYTLDPGFTEDFPTQKLTDFCQQLGIQHHTEKISIAELIKEKGENPCFTCAYFRRGATNRLAKSLGCNKIALAHHHDDAVETFFMNIITSGQLRTFLPVTWLSRKELHVIRPILYYREQEIRDNLKELGLTPLKSPCPHDGKTMRQEIKDYLPQLNKLNPKAYENIAAAMRATDNMEIWPPPLTQKTNQKKFHAFWQQDKNRKS